MRRVRPALTFALALAAPVHADATVDLFEATQEDNAATIAALIEAGADPNARSSFDETPLHTAAGAGNAAAVAALLEVGADPGARDRDGKLPFDYAKDNEALKGTDAYRRLHDARFE